MPSRPYSNKANYALENSIGYLLNRAAHLIAARFSDDLKAHDVNLQAWRALSALKAQNGQSMSELADHTGAELSYLYRSVVAMEERGLLTRASSATDKRITHLSLTEEGTALVLELGPKARAVERLSVAKVSREDLQATLRTLRAVCHNMVGVSDDTVDVNRKLTVARRVKRKAGGPSETPTLRVKRS